MRLSLLTTAALIGFAGNSLLTRGALGTGRLDAASFTCVRLVTGALTLALLVRLRSRKTEERGSWTSAAALAGYAIAFTLAYGRIGASVGALILFGGVQITMIGTGLVRGERPARMDWLGVALAIAGLLVFTVPGADAPDPLGTAMMATAGACWGAYSLAGRGNRDPLAATAGNFALASVPCVLFAGASFNSWHITSSGLWLAAISGSIASGVAYTLWYSALPSLQAWRAGIIQLFVPILTALSAAALLGESISSRLVLATALVVAGVLLTLLPGLRRV